MSDFDEASAVEAAFCHRVGLGATPSILTRSGRKELADIALAALKPFMRDGWQDMATAPKDGTVILGYSARIGVELVFWGCQPQHNPHSFWISASCNINHIDQPTHWMRAPSPPDVKEG